MPRFVVLEHELPAESERASHWDLMLEDGQVLLKCRYKSLFYVAMGGNHRYGGVKPVDVVGHFHSSILIFVVAAMFLS